MIPMTVEDELRKAHSHMKQEVGFLRNSIVIALLYVDQLNLRGMNIDKANLLELKDEADQVMGPQRELMLSLSEIYSDLLKKGKSMSAKSIAGGVCVMVFLGVSLALLLIFGVFPEYFGIDSSLHPYFNSSIPDELNSVNVKSIPKIFSIPIYVYVWGIIGALAYLIWSCVTHMAYRDFDNHYIPWYVFRILWRNYGSCYLSCICCRVYHNKFTKLCSRCRK